MPNVLIVAYYFPPLGMGGTQRPAKFAKYLHEFGWTPLVLTVKDVAYYARDPQLLADVGPVEVIRAGSLDPQRLLYKHGRGSSPAAAGDERGIAGRVNRMLVPDSKVLWIPFAVWRGLRLARDRSIDVIVTTSPPHSVHLTGWVLQRLTRTPWVADFRDPWAGGEFQPGSHRWQMRFDSGLQASVTRSADAVVAVSSGLAASISANALAPKPKVSVIPNGFDESDFKKVKDAPRREVFTFTLCGALKGSRGLRSLLAAIQALDARTHPRGIPLCLRLVGTPVDRDAARWIDEASASAMTEVLGYRPHHECISEMLGSDALVYIVPDGASPGHIPGKTFEYLRAAKPILAIGPKVEGLDILRRHLDVCHCTGEDIEAVSDCLRRMSRRRGTGTRFPNGIREYSRRNQAKALAQLLYGVRQGGFAGARV